MIFFQKNKKNIKIKIKKKSFSKGRRKQSTESKIADNVDIHKETNAALDAAFAEIIPTRKRSASSATISAFEQLVELNQSAVHKPWSQQHEVHRSIFVFSYQRAINAKKKTFTSL